MASELGLHPDPSPETDVAMAPPPDPEPPARGTLAPPDGRWNAGAWFGSTLGSSVWMLAAAILAVAHAPLAAIGPMLGAAVAIGLAVQSWRMRRHRRHLAALEVWLWVAFGCGLLTIGWIHGTIGLAVLWRVPGSPPAPTGSVAAAITAYGALLVYPSLALRFRAMSRS